MVKERKRMIGYLIDTLRWELVMSKLISFEGIDGVGKSTLISKLVEHYDKLKQKVVILKNIDDSSVRVIAIRSILNHNKSEYTNNTSIALLYLSEMYCTDVKIKSYLEEGYVVILDRWTHSTLAYAGSTDYNIDLIKKAIENLTKPDISILIDADVDVVMERLNKNRASLDLYENKDKLLKIQDRYNQLKNGIYPFTFSFKNNDKSDFNKIIKAFEQF